MSSISEKNLNSIRAGGFIIGAIVSLKKAICIVSVSFLGALVFLALKSEIPLLSLSFAIIIGLCMIASYFAFTTFSELINAGDFTKWMRNRDEVLRVTNEIHTLLDGNGVMAKNCIDEFTAKITSILNVEKVSKNSLSEKIGEIKDAKECITNLKIHAESYADFISNGISTINTLSTPGNAIINTFTTLGFIVLFFAAP